MLSVLKEHNRSSKILLWSTEVLSSLQYEVHAINSWPYCQWNKSSEDKDAHRAATITK